MRRARMRRPSRLPISTHGPAALPPLASIVLKHMQFLVEQLNAKGGELSGKKFEAVACGPKGHEAIRKEGLEVW